MAEGNGNVRVLKEEKKELEEELKAIQNAISSEEAAARIEEFLSKREEDPILSVGEANPWRMSGGNQRKSDCCIV
jgi:hypothetical protein